LHDKRKRVGEGESLEKLLSDSDGKKYFRELFGNEGNAPDDLLSRKTLTD
jgi:hypothetical protein